VIYRGPGNGVDMQAHYEFMRKPLVNNVICEHWFKKQKKESKTKIHISKFCEIVEYLRWPLYAINVFFVLDGPLYEISNQIATLFLSLILGFEMYLYLSPLFQDISVQTHKRVLTLLISLLSLPNFLSFFKKKAIGEDSGEFVAVNNTHNDSIIQCLELFGGSLVWACCFGCTNCLDCSFESILKKCNCNKIKDYMRYTLHLFNGVVTFLPMSLNWLSICTTIVLAFILMAGKKISKCTTNVLSSLLVLANIALLETFEMENSFAPSAEATVIRAAILLSGFLLGAYMGTIE